MDERSREAFRAWRSEPGDREAFDYWWHLYLRSEGLAPFDARIRLSGLFDDSGEVDTRGNRVWVHRTTGLRMVEVVPLGEVTMARAEHAGLHSGQLAYTVDHDQSFLIAEDVVNLDQWRKGLSGLPARDSRELLTSFRVSWIDAAGWCAQSKLRLPTHAHWGLARNAGIVPPEPSPEFIQDYYSRLVEPSWAPSRDPSIALGDEDYSAPPWSGTAPEDRVFEGFLVAGDFEDEVLEEGHRMSAFGLNVRVDPPTSWVDLTGKVRTIEQRASPLPEGEPSASDAMVPRTTTSTTRVQLSDFEMEDLLLVAGELDPLLNEVDSDRFGGEADLPVYYDETLDQIVDHGWGVLTPTSRFGGSRTLIAWGPEASEYWPTNLGSRVGAVRPVWR